MLARSDYAHDAGEAFEARPASDVPGQKKRSSSGGVLDQTHAHRLGKQRALHLAVRLVLAPCHRRVLSIGPPLRSFHFRAPNPLQQQCKIIDRGCCHTVARSFEAAQLKKPMD